MVNLLETIGVQMVVGTIATTSTFYNTGGTHFVRCRIRSLVLGRRSRRIGFDYSEMV